MARVSRGWWHRWVLVGSCRWRYSSMVPQEGDGLNHILYPRHKIARLRAQNSPGPQCPKGHRALEYTPYTQRVHCPAIRQANSDLKPWSECMNKSLRRVHPLCTYTNARANFPFNWVPRSQRKPTELYGSNRLDSTARDISLRTVCPVSCT